MSVRSKWLFIFAGNNNCGKSTIARHLVEIVAGISYKSLPSNGAYDIKHPYIIRKFRKIFVAGRSYQELVGEQRENGIYNSVEEYFDLLRKAGPDVDVAFAALHLDLSIAQQFINMAHRDFWNVCGIFSTYSIGVKPSANADIAELPWDEKWLAENPPSETEDVRERQLRDVAETIVQMLIDRTRGW